jgi:hypothetical protein
VTPKKDFETDKELSPTSHDSEIDSKTRNIVDEMIKKNDKKKSPHKKTHNNSQTQLPSTDSNPFKRKPKAENQIIESDQVITMCPLSQSPDAPPLGICKSSLEFIELQVNETRERVKNITILEFEDSASTKMNESSGSSFILFCNFRSSEQLHELFGVSRYRLCWILCACS